MWVDSVQSQFQGTTRSVGGAVCCWEGPVDACSRRFPRGCAGQTYRVDHRGLYSRKTRLFSHNSEVEGSNPSPATTKFAILAGTYEKRVSADRRCRYRRCRFWCRFRISERCICEAWWPLPAIAQLNLQDSSEPTDYVIDLVNAARLAVSGAFMRRFSGSRRPQAIPRLTVAPIRHASGHSGAQALGQVFTGIAPYHRIRM